MPEEFQLGNPVWAKMRGFRPWPGRITNPKGNMSKSAKKGFQCIYFFGTKNYAWIEEKHIKPYDQYKDDLIKSSDKDDTKKSDFKQAVDDIEAYIAKHEEDPMYDPENDDVFSRLVDESTESEDKAQTPKSVAKKPTAAKRTSTSSITKSTSAKKKRLGSPGENGAMRSFSNNHLSSRNVRDILDRPTVLDLPETPMVDLNNISRTLEDKKIEASPLVFGFIGLGLMGSGMVKNLINSGHRVNIWNRTLKKAEDIKRQADENLMGQVEVYQTPSDLIQKSDIIYCCVSDPAAVKDIIYGNCGVLHEVTDLDNKGYVEMTNIDDETSIDMSKLIISKGGRYLEAQIQGSKKEADEGNLIVLGAGDQTLFEDCQTCFQAIGKTIYFLGEVGFATKMNLVMQIMKGTALAGMAESFALAEKAGLMPKDVLEIFTQTNLNCPFLKGKAELILSSKFQNVELPLQHLQKDMRLALQLADKLKQPLLMASTSNEIYKHARRLGYGSYDAVSAYMRATH